MEIIKNASTGDTLKIDSKNRARTYSVIEDEASYINRVEEEMYSGLWSGAVTAATGGNYIIYFKNNSLKDVVINKIKHRVTGANGSISFWVNVTGTPGGTLTELTPSNRNAGSNNTADCTYYKSTNITGLTDGRQIGSLYGKADEEFEYAEPCSGFIIPPSATFAIKADNATAAHYGGMAFYFRDREESL